MTYDSSSIEEEQTRTSCQGYILESLDRRTPFSKMPWNATILRRIILSPSRWRVQEFGRYARRLSSSQLATMPTVTRARYGRIMQLLLHRPPHGHFCRSSRLIMENIHRPTKSHIRTTISIYREMCCVHDSNPTTMLWHTLLVLRMLQFVRTMTPVPTLKLSAYLERSYLSSSATSILL